MGAAKVMKQGRNDNIRIPAHDYSSSLEPGSPLTNYYLRVQGGGEPRRF